MYKLQLAFQVVEMKNTKSLAEKLNKYLKDPVEGIPEDLSEHRGKDAKVLDAIIEFHEKGVVHGGVLC